METNRIKLKTIGFAIAAVLVVETLAAWVKAPPAAAIIIVGVARCLEVLILLGITSLAEPRGIQALGIFLNRIRDGLLRGGIWSAGFGFMVLLGAVLLKMAGISARNLIAADLPTSLPSLLAFLVVGGIISPVAEEIFFRGLVFGYLRRWGAWAAIGISTALFVMAHASLQGVPFPQIVGGVLFALAYEKEKNLLVPITIHVLGNLAIFAVATVA